MTFEAIILCVITVIIFLLLVVSSPFPVWRNTFKLAYYTWANRDIPCRQKLRLLIYLTRSVITLLAKSLFWRLDSTLYKTMRPKNVVMIIGSPRSGTTYLHRILEQHEAFHALTYMQMRYPSETLWRLFDFFGLTNYIRKRNYWPKGDLGELAAKLHKHTFGDKEEIGMFLEEIMMSHFFLFRRFPSPAVANEVAGLEKLSSSEWAKVLKGVDGLLQRSLHYAGDQHKMVLLKENESVEFFKKMCDLYPNIKFVFIYRPTEQIAASYQNLSLVSTKVKTGIDPRTIQGWQEANDQFRAKELSKMINFYQSLPSERKILVSYDGLVASLEKEIAFILGKLNIQIVESYKKILHDAKRSQLNREKAYSNSTHSVDFDDTFDIFFQSELENR